MAGKKKQKKQLKKAQAEAKQLTATLSQTRNDQSKEAEKRLREQIKALTVEARFAASVNKTNAKKRRDIMMKYLMCLTNPSGKTVYRAPDGFPRATVVFNSVQTVGVIPNNAAPTSADDKGRFAFCISPTIAGSAFVRKQFIQGKVESAAGTPSATVTYWEYAQGCKVAYMNPDTIWDPDTSFQDLTPAFALKQSQIPSKGFVGPPVPSNNQWKFLADPNATAIAGSTTSDASGNTYFENGAAEAIRPVAMSVWLQRDASSMLNGGSCAIALMGPDSLAGNVIPYNWATATSGTGIWSGQGPIMDVENLSQVPGAYSGPLRNGAYAFWVPHRPTDMDLQSVANHVANDYPWIMVAGKAQTYDQGEVARIVINTVWEYTTVDQTRTPEFGGFDPEIWAVIKHLLKHQPTAMENDDHVAWWKHLLKTAASAGLGFLSGGPAGAVAGAAGYVMGQL